MAEEPSRRPKRHARPEGEGLGLVASAPLARGCARPGFPPLPARSSAPSVAEDPAGQRHDKGSPGAKEGGRKGVCVQG